MASQSKVTCRFLLWHSSCPRRLLAKSRDPLLGWETVGYRPMAPTFVLEGHCQGRDQRIVWRITFSSPDEGQQAN